MPRPARSITLVVALVLAMLVPTASTAGAQQGPNRVIANMGVAVEGTTDIIAWAKGDIHQPTSWIDPPGYFSVDGVASNFRSVIERVWFWPWWDENGNRADWAYVWAHECPFSEAGPPVCSDVAWAFVDYVDPTLTDFQITCWWDGGVRPPGDETWEICNAPNAHQDRLSVVRGSLVVQMSE